MSEDQKDIDTDQAAEALADAETRLAECYGLLKAVARKSRHVSGSPGVLSRELLQRHGIDWRADDALEA